METPATTEDLKVGEGTEVYVCLNCGRCSCDRDGHHSLAEGWSVSCAKAAILFLRRDLVIDAKGIVNSLSRRAVERIWRLSLN